MRLDVYKNPDGDNEDFVLQFLQRCRLLSGLRIKSLKTTLTVPHKGQCGTELVFIYGTVN